MRPAVSVPGMGNIRPLGRGTTPIGGASRIQTQGPYRAAEQRQYGRGSSQPAAFGGGAGARTQNAYSQALSQQRGNARFQQMEQANRGYQKQAEKARSADIYSQRADAARRYGMDESYMNDLRGINLSKREDIRNIRNRLDEQRRNTSLEYTHNMANLLAGGGLLSSAGNAWTAYRGGADGSGGYGAGWFGNPARMSRGGTYGGAGAGIGALLGGMIGGPGGAALGASAGSGTANLLSGLFA